MNGRTNSTPAAGCVYATAKMWRYGGEDENANNIFPGERKIRNITLSINGGGQSISTPSRGRDTGRRFSVIEKHRATTGKRQVKERNKS